MKSFLLLALVTGLFLSATAITRADIAPIKPKNPNNSLVVEIDNKVTKAQLIIPQKFLAKNGAAVPVQGGLGAAPTVIAGLCLSLAVLSGGIWLLRRGGRKLSPVQTGLAVGLCVGLTVLGVATPFLWGNGIAPRPVPQPASVVVSEDVQVVVVPQGNEIRLVVNQNMYQKLMLINNLGIAPGGFPNRPQFQPQFQPKANPNNPFFDPAQPAPGAQPTPSTQPAPNPGAVPQASAPKQQSTPE
jgi:hypothetical protein